MQIFRIMIPDEFGKRCDIPAADCPAAVRTVRHRADHFRENTGNQMTDRGIGSNAVLLEKAVQFQKHLTGLFRCTEPDRRQRFQKRAVVSRHGQCIKMKEIELPAFTGDSPVLMEQPAVDHNGTVLGECTVLPLVCHPAAALSGQKNKIVIPSVAAREILVACIP